MKLRNILISSDSTNSNSNGSRSFCGKTATGNAKLTHESVSPACSTSNIDAVHLEQVRKTIPMQKEVTHSSALSEWNTIVCSAQRCCSRLLYAPVVPAYSRRALRWMRRFSAQRLLRRSPAAATQRDAGRARRPTPVSLWYALNEEHVYQFDALCARLCEEFECAFTFETARYPVFRAKQAPIPCTASHLRYPHCSRLTPADGVVYGAPGGRRGT
jgi:hypothetical protein